MLDIQIVTLPHRLQRYDTVGDYEINPSTEKVFFRVSDLGDWRYEILIAVHEIIEFAIVKRQGIAIDAIDKFDMEYESRRMKGDVSEPGDSPKAPYHFAHCVATGVERMLAAILGVKWAEYEAKIDSL